MMLRIKQSVTTQSPHKPIHTIRQNLNTSAIKMETKLSQMLHSNVRDFAFDFESHRDAFISPNHSAALGADLQLLENNPPVSITGLLLDHRQLLLAPACLLLQQRRHWPLVHLLAPHAKDRGVHIGRQCLAAMVVHHLEASALQPGQPWCRGRQASSQHAGALRETQEV